jgi:hypothetical protein
MPETFGINQGGARFLFNIAVRYEKRTIVLVDVLDTRTKKFFLVAHPRVPH